MDRRNFFKRTIGGVVAAAVAPLNFRWARDENEEWPCKEPGKLTLQINGEDYSNACVFVEIKGKEVVDFTNHSSDSSVKILSKLHVTLLAEGKKTLPKWLRNYELCPIILSLEGEPTYNFNARPTNYAYVMRGLNGDYLPMHLNIDFELTVS